MHHNSDVYSLALGCYSPIFEAMYPCHSTQFSKKTKKNFRLYVQVVTVITEIVADTMHPNHFC